MAHAPRSLALSRTCARVDSRGNALFESGRYDEAVEHYGRALERAREANSVEDLVKILNNRSAVSLRVRVCGFVCAEDRGLPDLDDDD